MLNVFALIVLIVLVFAIIAVWVLLGMMPGRIARSRNHPQASAINVCGWWGVITMGLLCPVAYIWAYTNCGNADTTSDAGSEKEVQGAAADSG